MVSAVYIGIIADNIMIFSCLLTVDIFIDLMD